MACRCKQKRVYVHAHSGWVFKKLLLGSHCMFWIGLDWIQLDSVGLPCLIHSYYLFPLTIHETSFHLSIYLYPFRVLIKPWHHHELFSANSYPSFLETRASIAPRVPWASEITLYFSSWIFTTTLQCFDVHFEQEIEAKWNSLPCPWSGSFLFHRRPRPWPPCFPNPRPFHHQPQASFFHSTHSFSKWLLSIYYISVRYSGC